MEIQITRTKMEKREENFNIQAHAPTDNISGSEFPVSTRSVRYSDEELNEFKDIVISKLAEAKHDYQLLKGSMNVESSNGTDTSSSQTRSAEDTADGFSKDEIASLTIRQQKFIENLQSALTRIENKTYGICRISGRLISKERLKCVPHTTMCIDAKLAISRNN